eukprot:EG_transcript_15445
MPLHLYGACRFALVGAAAGSVAHQLYVTWQCWDGRLPLAKKSAEDAVRMWGVGAAAGQFALGLPWLVSHGVPVPDALLSGMAAAPLLAPLYVPACSARCGRWVAGHVPALLGGTAALTTAAAYVQRLAVDDLWAELWATGSAVGLGWCGLLTFLFSHRYNPVVLHLTRQWQAQGVVIPCGTLLPALHMAFSDMLALLMSLQAGGVLASEWWVLCAVTIAAAPALPNVLSQHNQRPIDLELAVWVHFGALGAIFILTLMFPDEPLAWALANQLWAPHQQDWQTLTAFEEERRTPPARPLEALLEEAREKSAATPVEATHLLPPLAPG